MERKTEKILNQQVTKKAMENTEADIRCIREAREFVSSYKFSPPSNNLLSSKAFLLGKYLSKLFAASPDEKIIIFVRRRFTAKCLFDCLKDSVPNMRMGILVGSRSGDVGEEKFSLRMQMLSVHRFRRGKLNCLIATSVAEEGLDIPDCSIVFRFDLYSTMIQYIQSRGRARHSASKYLHMVEKGNKAHMQIMKDCMEAEATMRSFCQSLPEDRLLDKENQSVVSEYNTEPFYIEPETGATLTFSSAMQVVSHYAANLPMDGDDIAQALYIVRPAGEKFICELVLPSSSSLGCYEGPRALTKSGAKRAAAFGACMQLRKDDHLDANLLPKLRTKERPKYANARLAVDAKKMNTYTYRPKPRFWDVKDETAPKKLWVTIYSVVEPGVMYEGKPLQPICIATREKFPRLPEFPVYGTKGAQSTLRLCQLDTPLEVTDEVLKLLDNFTDRCFFDVFNKHFEFTYSTLRYWLAPVLVDCEFNKGSLAAGLLDWKAMSVALSRELMFSPGDDPNILENKFFIDRVDRSRRFIAGKYKPGIGPLDKVPDHISQAVQFENIRDYSYNAGKKRKWQQVKWKIPDHEPVFSSERLLHRINFLDPPAERHTESVYEAYIIPSNFSVSTIPAGAVRSITMLPSVSTRIDGYLQAWELSKILRMGDIKLDLALEAITKDSDNTDQSLENQVNKQRGMGKNYERLEFLGDCYLKLVSCILILGEWQANFDCRQLPSVCFVYRIRMMNISFTWRE